MSVIVNRMSDRIPVDRISAEAATFEPKRAVLALIRILLTAVAGLLWSTGWVCAKTVRGTWRVLAWIVAAVRIGWRDAFQQKDIREGE